MPYCATVLPFDGIVFGNCQVMAIKLDTNSIFQIMWAEPDLMDMVIISFRSKKIRSYVVCLYRKFVV